MLTGFRVHSEREREVNRISGHVGDVEAGSGADAVCCVYDIFLALFTVAISLSNPTIHLRKEIVQKGDELSLQSAAEVGGSLRGKRREIGLCRGGLGD